MISLNSQAVDITLEMPKSQILISQAAMLQGVDEEDEGDESGDEELVHRAGDVKRMF
jgi:hypothetical protein